MTAFAHHLALALSVCALVACGLRVAGVFAGGLARAVAAVVVAAALAVGEALLLGLFGLGGSAAGLTLFAVASYAVARFALPEPAPLGVVPWARGLDRVAVVALGGALGLWGAWAAWLFLHPALGHDMVLYHLPEAVQWVHSGHPGAIDRIISSVPVGSYPLTHEVLLAWGMAIGRSFVWAVLVTALMPLLVVAAGWLGLRALGVDRVLRALALAALVATPAVIASQSGGASLDPAALAWLVSCAALAACAWREGRAELLPFALLAGCVAVGTKTTAAPLTLLVLACAGWALRRRLAPVGRWLAAAAVVGIGVGGVWYLRNTVQHGWPLWPFSSAPWGDPRPAIIADADVHFIERPGETLDRLGSYYLNHFGGPLLGFCGAVALALWARTRAALFACGAALTSAFIWMNAPFTGVFGSNRAFDVGTGDATRYLLPGAACALLAVALASRRGGAVRVVAGIVLAAAAMIGLKQTYDLGFPNAPAVSTPLAGLVLGALAALTASRLRSLPLPSRAAFPALAAALLALGALGARAADGFVERHGTTGTRESPLAAWFADQPAWRDGERPVASTWSLVATLAGDRLQHPLELVDAREACARGEAAGWLAVDRAEARAQQAPPCPVPAGFEDRDYQAYGPAQWEAAAGAGAP